MENKYYQYSPIRSFYDLIKNQIIMLTRKRIWSFIIPCLYIIFIIITFVFLDFDFKDMIFVVIFIFCYFLLFFIIYYRVLNTTSLSYLRNIEIEKDGFKILCKDGFSQFIKYEDINVIKYNFYPLISMVLPLFSSFKNFSIKYNNNEGEKEIIIFLNINRVYEALDVIIFHIPKKKQINIRTINGKVVASFDKKTGFIDIETFWGEIFLIILAIIVAAFWIYLGFFFK